MIKSPNTTLLRIGQLSLVLLALSACNVYKPTAAPAEMEGIWIGLGQVQISNEYLNQRELPVMLDIDSLGVVNGFIGDAAFTKIKLEQPAWWLRLFGKKKLRVTFILQDPIVRLESFRRDGGTLVFDSVQDGEMLCTFTSSGSQTSVSDLILKVTNIKLRHP